MLLITHYDGLLFSVLWRVQPSEPRPVLHCTREHSDWRQPAVPAASSTPLLCLGEMREGRKRISLETPTATLPCLLRWMNPTRSEYHEDLCLHDLTRMMTR